jgi:hypothetical protein
LNITKLALLVLFSFGASVQAEEYCQITRPIEKALSDRSFQINFPDGRTFIIVGHIHAERRLPQQLLDLSKKTTQEITTQEFLNEFNTLGKLDSKTKHYAKADLEIINRLRELKKKDHYVAVEASESVTKLNLQSSKEMLNRFESFFNERAIEKDEKFETTLLTILSAPYFLYAQNPDRLSNIQVIGVESKALGMAHREALDLEEDALKKVKALIKGNEELSLGLGSAVGYFNSIYDSYVPETDYQKNLNMISLEGIPAEYHQAFMNWVEAKLTEFNTRKLRDRMIVQKMTARDQSAILFIGSRHQNSILRLFQQACTQTMTN